MMIQALAAALILAVPQADEARIRSLIKSLSADFLETREAARQELEKIGALAEPFLLEALGDGDFRVRRSTLALLTALKSVKARGRAAALFEVDPDRSVQNAAFALLLSLGKDAEDDLIVALGNSRRRYRLDAVKKLMEFKSAKCAGPMADLFENEEDAEIKDAAFKCMQALGDAAKPFLLKHLADDDPKVRRACLEGLRASKSDDVIDAIGKLFAKERDTNAIQVAYAYLRDVGEKAEPHFLEALKSAEEDVRQRSITGLQALKSEKAIEPVAELFRRERSLGLRKSAAAFLESFGLKAEKPLIEALESKNPEVRLMAIESLGKIKSDKPLEHIGRLFREDKDKKVHLKAFEYLERLGSKAEEDLLFALDDEDKAIRRRAILALGKARSEKAIPRLLDFMAQLDPALRTAARDAVVRIGVKAVDRVKEAAKSGKLTKTAVDEVLALFYQEEVERLLGALVTDRGGTGTYAGQFKGLSDFGVEKARPVLLKIAREPAYAFRVLDERPRPRDYERKMREMAITALGALGDKEAASPLKELLATFPGAPSLDRDDTIQDEVVLALHRLGDDEPLDAYLRDVTTNAEKALQEGKVAEGCGELFYVGLILNRTGKRDESKIAYTRILDAVKRHKLEPDQVSVLPSTYYNLACLASLKGETAEAVDWLRKSVVAGFKDRQWIKMDRDLDAIRGEDGYKKLLADDALFETKP